ATFVYGQLGSFTTNSAAVSADNLNQPRRVLPDGNGPLYIVDQSNNRALEYLQPTCPATFDFDFSGSEYTDCFRDVLRGGDIDAGTDVGGTTHSALNFSGGAGSSGATWLTVYDATPDTLAPGATFGAETICADVLFHTFNNVKGAGPVALLNEGV